MILATAIVSLNTILSDLRLMLLNYQWPEECQPTSCSMEALLRVKKILVCFTIICNLRFNECFIHLISKRIQSFITKISFSLYYYTPYIIFDSSLVIFNILKLFIMFALLNYYL